jgi:hypothetical protein
MEKIACKSIKKYARMSQDFRIGGLGRILSCKLQAASFNLLFKKSQAVCNIFLPLVVCSLSPAATVKTFFVI